MGRPPKHQQERRERPSFGDYLRAARLGWHWSEAHGCFVRTSDLSPETFLVEVAPAGLIPAECSDGLYRCWWEGPKGDAILQHCAVLQGVHRPEHYHRWVVDMDGREVSPTPKGRK